MSTIKNKKLRIEAGDLFYVTPLPTRIYYVLVLSVDRSNNHVDFLYNNNMITSSLSMFERVYLNSEIHHFIGGVDSVKT